MNTLEEITSFTSRYRDDLMRSRLETVSCEDRNFDIQLLELKPHGRPQKNRFTLLLVAGVHGLETIGVTVLLHYLSHLIENARWNDALKRSLASARIVAIPALNPTGIFQGRRATAEGIDLMRNAPVAAEKPVPLLGGHQFSPMLPYYSGTGDLALESRALIRAVKNLLDTSSGMIALDLHSGFGARDRVWTPWSMSSALPPHWNHYLAIEKALNESFPDHVYKFERQSDSYQTNGDLWDYLLLENQNLGGPLFLPLALEMGSWNWLKKAPWRAFTKLGWFHPVAPHRVSRACRRHTTLLDFLVSVCANSEKFFGQEVS
ncbi:MAG: DUF2817 domain-containing protein [Proteobacteria bacterium]|nr:DUF2817 domain-containing protein [Pseudomonadota bacterium]